MTASAQAAPESAVPPQSWSERNQQWLVATIARLREHVETRARDPSAPSAAAHSGMAIDAVPGFTPALLRCAQVFGLTPFESELLLLVAGVELDRGLRAAIIALNGGAFSGVSFSLALGVLPQPHWDALSPDAPLRYWRLIEPDQGAPVAQATLRLDERVLHYVAGVASNDAQLHGVARFVDAPSVIPGAIDELLVQRIAHALVGDGDRGPVVVLHGTRPDADTRRDLALAAVTRLSHRALWITARDLPGDAGELATLARYVDREVALGGVVPLLDLDGAGTEHPAVSLASELRSGVLWLGPPSASLTALPHAKRVVHCDLPAPDPARTRSAVLARWRALSPLAADDDEAVTALERAAGQFHFGPAALDDVVEQLGDIAPAERGGAVWTAARAAARGGLDALAQRLVTRAGFEDLVLPPTQLAALRDITGQLRHRDRVYRDWGFGDKYPRGQGLTALFVGESGTGKTLAAEAIANEVELDLYRVDLATLVSKYIGETEKNLKRLFDAAESSGAVLLFDEADALFGKRSEVKDSHDRYANIEVAYLLQRVEAYRGLAILTTNMKSALDRAFLRRIRFVVQFPFPDAAAREMIWRREFPHATPVGTIDFPALARLSLSGGNIHSIVLNAAFKAADGPGRIEHAMLADAARAEFAKLERTFSEAAVGGTA